MANTPITDRQQSKATNYLRHSLRGVMKKEMLFMYCCVNLFNSLALLRLPDERLGTCWTLFSVFVETPCWRRYIRRNGLTSEEGAGENLAGAKHGIL